jgi:AraC family transcriptional regulator of adaptative response/methylated-DNA-[protein]-cysteine methyltransferase
MTRPLTPTITFDDDQRWQAVIERDRSAAGSFVFGVRSTGVFCRPGCPSRRPGRAQVEFFETIDGAIEAGYRACLRCKPTELPAERQLVERVRTLIDEAEEAPTLDYLARETGVSASHLQRVFKAETGSTPKQFAAAVRLERFKCRLRTGDSVTAATYDAGFGSSRALYETATRSLGMQPRTYQRHGRGEQISYAVVPSDLGPMILAATRYGLCFVGWDESPETLAAELRSEFSEAKLIEDLTALEPYVESMAAYLRGDTTAEVALDLRGTPFQLAVWQALRSIPPGETRSYGELAATLGVPKAARAVGRANATNRLPPFIPCHRAVGANGTLTGYRWGVERKRALLDIEQGAHPATGETSSGLARPLDGHDHK